eukprot:scaffold88911_cov40-Phaeocystis_antarctica.AAC.1
MPERRLERGREHQLTEALQAPPEAPAGSFQALGISPIELCRPWADGCVRVHTQFGRGFQARLQLAEAKVDIWAKAKQPEQRRDGLRTRTQNRTLLNAFERLVFPTA